MGDTVPKLTLELLEQFNTPSTYHSDFPTWAEVLGVCEIFLRLTTAATPATLADSLIPLQEFMDLNRHTMLSTANYQHTRPDRAFELKVNL